MDTIRTKLVEPRDLWWEKGGLAAPAVENWNGKVTLLYQAIGADGIHRLSLGTSEEGEHFVQLEQPIFEGLNQDTSSRLGATNPRLSQVNKKLFVCYEALNTYDSTDPRVRYTSNLTPWRKRLVIAQTSDLRQFTLVSQPFPTLDATDGVLLNQKIAGRFWLFYALEGQIFCNYTNNFKHWEGGLRLAAGVKDWEASGIAPAWAVKTEKGWLVFYNATNKVGRTSVGVLLADPANPTVVLQRAETPILTAGESWERGSVTLAGGVEKRGSLWLYYGAGGSLAVAKIPLETILTHLHASAPPA